MSLQEHTIGWLVLISAIAIVVTIACIIAVATWVVSVEDRLEAQEIYLEQHRSEAAASAHGRAF